VKDCRGGGKNYDYTIKSERNTKPGTKPYQERDAEGNRYSCTSCPETAPGGSTATEMMKIEPNKHDAKKR